MAEFRMPHRNSNGEHPRGRHDVFSEAKVSPNSLPWCVLRGRKKWITK